MRFHKLSIILFSIMMVQTSRGEEKSAPSEASMPKEQKEFIEKSSKINTLANKISENEKQFNHLVIEKTKAKGTIEKQKIIHEMVELAAERNKNVETYNKLKSDVALRYPNSGEHLNRRYQTQDKRSVEELEGVAGLDEILTRTKKFVEKKYKPFMGDEPSGVEPGQNKKAKTNRPASSEEPKRLRLEK